MSTPVDWRFETEYPRAMVTAKIKVAATMEPVLTTVIFWDVKVLIIRSLGFLSSWPIANCNDRQSM
jgi:hypothetical protein